MIVRYEVDPDNDSIINVVVDDEPLYVLHARLFRRTSSLPKEAGTAEELMQALNEQLTKKARQLLLNKLAKKNEPSFELRRLLEGYMIPEETIDILINEFQESGYINDEAWVEGIVRSASSQKKGPGAVERKLREKRAPEVLIEMARSLVDDSDEQADNIRRLIKTRYRARNLLDYREKEKTIGALVRRGFDVNLVRDVINEFPQA